MVITGMVGEVLWFCATIACESIPQDDALRDDEYLTRLSASVFSGDSQTWAKQKRERDDMLIAHYPGWVVEDDGKDSKEKKGKKAE